MAVVFAGILPNISFAMKLRTAPVRQDSSAEAGVEQRLVTLLSELAPRDGFLTSRLPEVGFMRTSGHIPRTPITYECGIFILVQGRKTGFVGAKKFVYDANHFLVLSVPMPFECETEGTPEKPMLALKISVTPAAVTELLMQLEHLPPADGSEPQAMQATVLGDQMRGATIRLLECLRCPDDSRVLGPGIVREIIYRVLRGNLGTGLRALAAPDSHFGRISRVLNRLHTDYTRDYDIASLARDCGMSVAAFHTRFKAITSSSPLQYLKNIRLNKALMLMLNEGSNASSAATLVGYESASQFSREFKRLFGDSPAAVATHFRRNLLHGS